MPTKESLSGINNSVGDVGNAIQRAQDKKEEILARASAMDTLTDEGVFTDVLDSSDSLKRDLNKVRFQSAVDDEFERIKKEMDKS